MGRARPHLSEDRQCRERVSESVLKKKSRNCRGGSRQRNKPKDIT